MGPLIYARIAKNQIRLRNISTQQEVTAIPETPFTTVRMLVGEFVPYEACLKKGVSQIGKKGFSLFSPTLIIHAIEMNEGGLCEIEKRILREGAVGAGARRVIVHEGTELSDQQAVNLSK